MREKDTPASLGEMLGKGRNQVTMENLPEVLGLKMPEIPKNRVGKLRLIHALQQRFGANYRQTPGVNDLLSEFEQNLSDNEIIEKNKES